MSMIFRTTFLLSYLLLLHELRVGAVVDDALTEDRSGEGAVDLLGVDVLELAIEDKVIALGAKADGGGLSEEDKSKDVAVLMSVSNAPAHDNWTAAHRPFCDFPKRT